MTNKAPRLLPLAVAALATTGLRAQFSFSEPFDSSAANVTVLQQADTVVTYVDYSNFTVGATAWSIPEAPRPIAGGAPTSGVLIQCNLAAGAATGVNLIAGSTPIPFTGRYRLSFDAWINVPLPIPAGGTEQLLWGVGVDNAGPIEARNTRGSNTMGVWGWLAGDNGYGSEDAAINLGDIELADWGDTLAGESFVFNEAFDSNAVGGPNGAAANTWCRVDVDVDANGTRVFFNGVEFFNETTALAPAGGFAMIGYEDPFASISALPDGQWCILDNFRVITPAGCTGLGTAVQQGTSAGGEILNGGGPPAIGAPMTIRLRGGPASFPCFLAVGFPAPFTIPVPLGPGCTINSELAQLYVLVGLTTNADGGAILNLNLPQNPMLCGSQLGWQYLTLDIANPACPFVLTEGLVTTIGG